MYVCVCVCLCGLAGIQGLTKYGQTFQLPTDSNSLLQLWNNILNQNTNLTADNTNITIFVALAICVVILMALLSFLATVGLNCGFKALTTLRGRGWWFLVLSAEIIGLGGVLGIVAAAMTFTASFFNCCGGCICCRPEWDEDDEDYDDGGGGGNDDPDKPRSRSRSGSHRRHRRHRRRTRTGSNSRGSSATSASSASGPGAGYYDDDWDDEDGDVNDVNPAFTRKTQLLLNRTSKAITNRVSQAFNRFSQATSLSRFSRASGTR